MPRVSVVAKNYAKALFLVANKNNITDKITSELTSFKQSFTVSFANELKNPVISKNDLARIMNEITQKFQLSALSSNFFASIVKNRRLNLFPEIYEEFLRLTKQQNNVLEVEVITAAKVKKEQVDLVKNLFAKKYPEKTISIKETIREQIFGGFQIKIDSKLIDASLRNQIESLTKECLKATN